MSSFDAVIVGAGIAGLCLAQKLREQGLSFCVLEKSRGLGGRMATRRDGLATYDHGAQFYKIKNGDVVPFDAEIIKKNAARIWFGQDGAVFKAAPGGMTQIAKTLAEGLPVRLDQRVVKITEDSVELENGNVLGARRIYLTCPLPQSLQILRDSRIDYPVGLDQVQYAKALVGLLEMSTDDPRAEAIVYQQDIDGRIFSVANQLSKQVGSCLAFTVTMRPNWSEDNFEGNDDLVLHEIQASFNHFLDSRGVQDQRITKATLKKWRYSHPLNTVGKMFELVGAHQRITLLGDAFGGASVAGAAASAWATPLI